MDNTRGASFGIAATLALLGCALSAPTRADTLVVNDQLQVRQSNLARPARGLTMAAVESKFGAPATKHDAVGTPPITRWDYPQFAVFFEKDRVIDSVLPPQASEPSTSPASTPITSAPGGAPAPSETQEPLAPTPASSPMPTDAPISSGAPNPPAAAPADTAGPSAAPAAPTAPATPAAASNPTLPAAQNSAPSEPPLPVAQSSAPSAPDLPAAQTSPATHSTSSSEDPMGVVPVSMGPSAATPTPSSGTPAAPANPHP